MTYQQRVDEVKALIVALDDKAVVHDRARIVDDWGKFIGFFKGTDGRINGWEITRKAPLQPVPPDIIEIFVLRKYYGVQDAAASDLEFQEQVNAAVRKFRETTNLTFGAVPIGLVVTQLDIRLFGSVLVHFAECELRVECDYDTF